MEPVVLNWARFETFADAKRAFWTTPCVYVQADRAGKPVRVGKASKGLDARYRGGTGWALDAAMHGSGNVVFVAEVNADLVGSVEAALIWEHRELLSYNRVGMRFPPAFPLTLVHEGEAPAFVG